MKSTEQMRHQRNVASNMTFGCTFTCPNYKGVTLRANTQAILFLQLCSISGSASHCDKFEEKYTDNVFLCYKA